MAIKPLHLSPYLHLIPSPLLIPLTHRRTWLWTVTTAASVTFSTPLFTLFTQTDMAVDGDYCRVITPETPMNDEVEEVCNMMNEMVNMRSKWLFKVRCKLERAMSACHHLNTLATLQSGS